MWFQGLTRSYFAGEHVETVGVHFKEPQQKQNDGLRNCLKRRKGTAHAQTGNQSPNCKVHAAVLNDYSEAMQLRLSVWQHFSTAGAIFLAVWRMLSYAIKYVSAANVGMTLLADDVAVLNRWPSLREVAFLRR